ncbi:MAG TPA: di-heme oxidoredictase family protein [Polyangiaceae bacterium]|nr:di-heme oxidoredictase family protein [Polyangiaceae bacterium]
MWGRTFLPLAGIGLTAAAMSCSAGQSGNENPLDVGYDTDDAVASSRGFGDPLPRLSADEQARFLAGKIEFANNEGVDDGLGPVFNDTSCGNCHVSPALGGSSNVIEMRFGAVANGKFDPLAQLGGSLIQVKGIGAAGDCTFNGELVPKQATVSAGRRTVPLFGLGLVDALSESTLIALRDSEANQSPHQAGTLNLVHDIAHNRTAVGRFGWKDQNPTLHQFSGDAYVNEMGITSPEFPIDNCPQGDCDALARCNPATAISDADGADVQKFFDFMTFLAPPPSVSLDDGAKHGRRLFEQIGCQNCHVESLTTSRNTSLALSHVTFHPYSDFLLHDMGTLGDGITQDGATGKLMRTAPLWGLRKTTTFLHDGSATSVEQAITRHQGQGRDAGNAFTKLNAADRRDVLNFLNRL